MLARQRRGRGDRGATLVEAALITPVLLLFVFAIFEFGFAFRDYLGVANTTRDGVREASVAGNVADADYRILRSIRRASAALPDGALDQIIIFEASGPDGGVPAACLGGSQTGVCNTYSPSDMDLDLSWFGCQTIGDGDPVNSPDRFWCPEDREVSVTAGLDFIGIYVSVHHEYITGFFGDSITFEDTTILQVEPQDI